jgi:hypothetical protein
MVSTSITAGEVINNKIDKEIAAVVAAVMAREKRKEEIHPMLF